MSGEEMLKSDFFKKDTSDVAKNLLGKKIIRNISGNFFCAKIVETEAYLGLDDKACHSYGGNITKRNEILYKDGGYIYVYLIYGMYNLLNIVTRTEKEPEAVLIRAVEPIDNLDKFANNRFNRNYEDLSNYKKKNLTNGPGKLTMGMAIDRNLNGKVLSKDYLYIEDFEVPKKIVVDKRVGIDYAGEDAELPLRFYIGDNKFVSKK